ncbi:MAG: hypothetical protein U0938_14125 [Thiobacillus sp.]|nr:hypothetical protein [Thiobacillus sp.]
MPKIDDYEFEILSAYEKGQLKSIVSKAELTRLKAAAHSTAIKETQFLRSMPDVHASIKEGMSEPLDTSSRKLDW